MVSSSNMSRSIFALLLMSVFIADVMGTPSVTLITKVSTESCSPDFLVNGEDSTRFEYEITEGNADYSFTRFSGPQLFYAKSDETEINPCGLFDKNGTCTTKPDAQDECSCEERAPGVFRLIFNQTANVNNSLGSIFIEWTGTHGRLKFDVQRLPKILEYCPERHVYPCGCHVLHVYIGLGVILPVLTIATLMCICRMLDSEYRRPLVAVILTPELLYSGINFIVPTVVDCYGYNLSTCAILGIVVGSLYLLVGSALATYLFFKIRGGDINLWRKDESSQPPRNELS